MTDIDSLSIRVLFQRAKRKQKQKQKKAKKQTKKQTTVDRGEGF